MMFHMIFLTPRCLTSISRHRRGRCGRQEPAPSGVLLEESGDCACRVAVQAPAVLAAGLSLSQTAAVSPVVRVGHRAQLGEQVRLTVRGEEDLELPQMTQWAGGRNATDAALVPPQGAEEPFKLQIIGRQSRNVVAIEQLGSPGAPQTLPGTEEGALRPWIPGLAGKCSQQGLHL